MVVSWKVYAYWKFWKTPSIVVRSERADPEDVPLVSSAGAKGFLHPTKSINEIKKYFKELLIKPPFQITPTW